jgi:hypothetical protein
MIPSAAGGLAACGEGGKQSLVILGCVCEPRKKKKPADGSCDSYVVACECEFESQVPLAQLVFCTFS